MKIKYFDIIVFVVFIVARPDAQAIQDRNQIYDIQLMEMTV